MNGKKNSEANRALAERICATLHAAGVTDISTSEQAAQALRPLL